MYFIGSDKKTSTIYWCNPVLFWTTSLFLFPYLDYRSEYYRLKIVVVRTRGHLSHCNLQKCGLCPQNFLWQCFIVNETYSASPCLCKTLEELTKWDRIAEGFLLGFFWLHKHQNNTFLVWPLLWLSSCTSGKKIVQMNQTVNWCPIAVMVSASLHQRGQIILSGQISALEPNSLLL